MEVLSRRAWLATTLAALAPPALPQPWPARPPRLIVPYPAGSQNDLVARALAERLAQPGGQRVAVENRAGAGGIVGMGVLARAAPDGATLAFSSTSPLSLGPALARVPYDPERDFTPVVGVMLSPVLVLATAAVAVRDLRELLQRAADWPDTVRWATWGTGSPGHLIFEELQAAARVRMVHVPYKGGRQQVAEAIGAQFEVLSVNAAPGLLQPIRAGRLRPLAVGAPRRLDSLPQVPTLAELGYARANRSSHFGVFAPGNLPLRILDRLNGEVNAVLETAAFRARLQAGENLPTGGTSRDFARQIAAEAEATAATVRAAGIRGE